MPSESHQRMTSALGLVRSRVRRMHRDWMAERTVAALAKLEALENHDPAGLRDLAAEAIKAHVTVHPTVSPHDLAKVVLAVPELAAALAKVTAYENAIAWDVTCAGCARLLDASIADHDRAEQADARAAAAEARVRELEDTPVDHETYVSVDDFHTWLTCGECRTQFLDIDAGTTLAEQVAADAGHTCPRSQGEVLAAMETIRENTGGVTGVDEEIQRMRDDPRGE